MKRTIFVVCLLLFGVALGRAQQFPPSRHISIDELRAYQLPEVVLESVNHTATWVEVKGTIGGAIRFELLLPDNWNNRFVMGGGGGFVGSVQNGARASVSDGYATVGTDAGHEWPVNYMAGWAYNNLEAKIDFGYLAVHRTAEVAKALIRAYYGFDPHYSYFIGCSRGGGQAMMEAQRYPDDFNGIVAGAPAFDWTGFAANAVQIEKVLYPDPRHLDHPVLDKKALTILQKAIIDQCDAQDGLKDGIIQDPPSVHFDLSKVEGLTDDQRKAIEAIYAGVHGSHGQIYPGYTAGAECDPNQWAAWIVGPIPGLTGHVPDLMFAFGTQIFKFLIFNDPDWDYSTYNFSNFAKDSELASTFLNATNFDLYKFQKRNNKLILSHGWADPALPPQATVNYYRQLRASDPNCADYCRLFMIPGCFHCGGGPGAADVNWLGTIVDWVEHAKAPDKVIANKAGPDGKLIMTRPLYCYPTVAAYNGSGDPNSADSFGPKPATH
ncbi:MAG TPA: tannase/feruloyl esterase family alpha/beta hydrolase [Verrucomicrobiae bacterium]